MCDKGFERYMGQIVTPSGISAVIWDFDDTLVNSLPARVHALTLVFRDTDIRNVDPELFLSNLAGYTFEASLARLAENLGRPKDLFERYKRIYWAKKPGTLHLYPGVKEALDYLELRGVLLGLVTLKARSFYIEGVWAGALAELKEVGVAGRFPVVIGIDDVREPKPHPEGILRALERLNVPAEQALVVGDTVADIQAAREAGCWSCLATWGVPDGPERARRSNPDMIAETPRAISGIAG